MSAWLVAAALVAMVLSSLGGPAPTALGASSRPRLELVVEPLHPVVGTQAEVVAQVLPAALGRKGSVTASVFGPGETTGKSISIVRVQGATPGTFEGLAPVPARGRYHVTMRYQGGGQVLTATRSFVVVSGSPFAHDLSIVIVVVILGGAWLLMRRRR